MPDMLPTRSHVSPPDLPRVCSLQERRGSGNKISLDSKLVKRVQRREQEIKDEMGRLLETSAGKSNIQKNSNENSTV